MSLLVSELVWKHSAHKGSERLVLLALARYVHDDGTNAWPSIATLAADTQLSQRSVQYALHHLVASGEIQVEEKAGPNQCNRYTILIGRWCKDCTPAKIAPVQSTTSSGAKIAGGGAKYDTEVVQPIAPDPLLRTVKNSHLTSVPHTARQTAIPDDFEPTSEMLEKAIAKYPGMDVIDASDAWIGSMRANTQKYRYTSWSQAWWNGLAFAERKGWHRKYGGNGNGRNNGSGLRGANKAAHPRPEKSTNGSGIPGFGAGFDVEVYTA